MSSWFWPNEGQLGTGQWIQNPNLPRRLTEADVRRVVREELERALDLEALLQEVKGLLDE
jgi:hypothetical protein